MKGFSLGKLFRPRFYSNLWWWLGMAAYWTGGAIIYFGVFQRKPALSGLPLWATWMVF